MNKSKLMEILPHRPPMLLLDEVELKDDGTCVSRCTVQGDEFFLQGHFPGNPVVPGVILCEMMAQSACLVVGDKGTAGKLPLLTGLDKIRFRHKVVPGDTVVFEVRLTRSREPFYFVEGTGCVGEDVCIKGEISFALVDLPAA